MYNGDFDSIFREDATNNKTPMTLNVDTSDKKQLSKVSQTATSLASMQAANLRRDNKAEKIKASSEAKAAKVESSILDFEIL